MEISFLLLLPLLTASYGYGVNEDLQKPKGISSDLCIPAGGSKVCSGNGNCVFAQCKCEPGWSGKFCSECKGCTKPTNTGKCAEYRACVECSVFGQYWKYFRSAYECQAQCSNFNFVHLTAEVGGVCTQEYEPVCGLDGQTYGNKCNSELAGVAVHCKGSCPCPASEVLCEFPKLALDSDSICPAYRFSINGTYINVYRPPCLADDLEVNIGVWRGEVGERDGNQYPHGWGHLVYEAEDHLNREEYRGSMVYGVREGHGTLYWKDGSYYSGEWRNDLKDGEGTLFYSNGDIYTGHWVAEKKTGEGKYMYAKGGEYSGLFLDGVKHGKGKSYTVTEEHQWELYEGEYVNGWRSNGNYNTSGEYYFSGEFSLSSGAFSGSGTYTWSCGKRYTGSFANGSPEGHGEMLFPQGWTYLGAFHLGKFEGVGKFSWSKNHYFEGTFKNGRMTGVGQYGFENGGLFDSSVGLYYPNRDDRSKFLEAHFDGQVLRVKKISEQQKKPSYGV